MKIQGAFSQKCFCFKYSTRRRGEVRDSEGLLLLIAKIQRRRFGLLKPTLVFPTSATDVSLSLPPSLSSSSTAIMVESVELPSRLGILPFRNKVLLPGAIIRIRCTSSSRYVSRNTSDYSSVFFFFFLFTGNLTLMQNHAVFLERQGNSD